LLTQARAAAGKARWSDAQRLYQEVLSSKPDQLEALEGLGVTSLALAQPARAVEFLRRARRGAPRNARLLALLARAQRQSGVPAEAAETCQKALELDAQQPAIWLELALCQFEFGALEPAIASCFRAIQLNPNDAAAWHLSAKAFGAGGKLSEALRAERQALAKNPWLFDAHLNEGQLLERSGAPDAALISYFVASLLSENGAAREPLERLLAALASSHEARASDVQLVQDLARERRAEQALALGRLLREQQRPASVIVCFELALSLAPDIEVCRELAEALFHLGQRERAQQRLLQGLELSPRDVQSYRLLSSWLASELRFVGSDVRWQTLLGNCPDDVVALVNLGAAAQRMGRPSEAVPLQRRALQLRPDLIEPYINLAAALCDQGSVQEAALAHRQALAIDPTRWAVHSNLLLNAHFDPELSPEALLGKHREFGRALSEWLGPMRRKFLNGPDPGRRLRIGYVSPDFNDHPVAHFLEPVLREHDPRLYEVFCYSDVARPDAVTTRLREYATVYRACAGDTDEALAELIRMDEIDILVDLAGHGLHNRLPVFARKPSPVQVTWLGYFDTTGLEAMDYRIADAHSVPPGAEQYFVERVVRLPRSSTCFLPRLSPEPAPSPFHARGHLSFGCFSNPTKVSRDVAAVFGRILRNVAHSRLLFKYHTFADPGIQARFLRWFAEEGIARDRIVFQGHSPLEQYLAAFGEVDVALDPFPYSGETTALHTLWMGVPLVALEGRTVAQRLASRVLRVAELHEYVARSSDDYVRIAERLAADPAGLASSRRSLRARLEASPLLDHRGVTRELEAAYRGMWHRWCKSQGVVEEREHGRAVSEVL
jgi:predicted O-linked N-acetylglucosamine transferase (SPINDLY family)/thioredoxin-like negative regulator of GroEL